MIRRNYLSTDERIALVKYNEAIAQRKLQESKTLVIIRENAELMYDSKVVSTHSVAQAISDAVKDLNNAWFYELSCEKTLKKIRGKKHE